MILNIDHIVLTINDMEKTISFYRDVLGMTVKEFQPVGGGETRKSLSFGNQKINLHHARIQLRSATNEQSLKNT